MTIDFRPEQERVINEAIQAGLIDAAGDVVEVGVETLRTRLQSQVASSQSLPANEWMQRFRAWSHSFPTTPLLSDEAISRGSIYGNRGL